MDDIHALGNSVYAEQLQYPDSMIWGLRDSCLVALDAARMDFAQQTRNMEFSDFLSLVDRVKITIHFDRDMWDVRANLKLEVNECKNHCCCCTCESPGVDDG